ncbi:transcriptional regulator, y4mF family [Mycobacteroides abscessus subsp. massiliense]|uniref:Transcriptional regulator, y4mF family n=1 Tax=Mycobacteroides abscessus subsp. massiliense TaxID=1962118 RepID=A0A1T8VK49_9MYCO|nr:helix-turn-helix transcriptional regulator [Mycobacteroides abscessus]SKN05444.1 transcriptional regulator, y4mF family [Mycobacteroides abscessus subsp. massiliense]
MLIRGSICNNFDVADTPVMSPEDAEGWARVGRLIRQRRADKRLGLRNQQDLADRVGVHKQTINYIENGKRPIRESTARQIEAAVAWKTYAIDHIRQNPDATATTYADDPISASGAAVDMARSMLQTAEALYAKSPEDPLVVELIMKMLNDFEAKLTELAKHEFTTDILEVLNEIYARRLEINKTHATN